MVRLSFTVCRLLLLVLVLWPCLAQAQTTVVTNKVRLSTAPCTLSSGTTDPTGGANCDIYAKSDGSLWQKTGGVWHQVGLWQRNGTNISPAIAGDGIGSTTYASETTGWRITDAGAADFRYLYVDELHAKAFIADLEQALAGSQIISKSVAKISAAFDTSSDTRLVVEDFPGYDSVAVFEAGDNVLLRAFNRTAGSLTIANAYGTVALDTSYGTSGYDAATHTQAWTWTKIGTPTVTLGAGALALDLGVSGNGYYEVNSVDGMWSANSPYAQIVTWATTPSNKTVRARMGNLFGITGSAEYGLLAGTYLGTDGSYFRATDQHFDLHGITAKWWDGSTNVITIDPNAGAPYFSLGNPAPTTYASGAGIWMGKDSSAYKFRVGNPSTSGVLAWDGTALTAAGWTLGATALTSTSSGNTIGLDTAGTNAIYAGPTGAPNFTVTQGGVMTATGATLTNGQITFDNGSFMKVAGVGFGTSNQFVEWFGPHQASVDDCDESNAVMYLKVDGSAFFGGTLLVGQLVNTTTASGLTNANAADLGPYSSLGKAITISLSYEWHGHIHYTSATGQRAAYDAVTKQSPSAQLILSRSINGGAFVDVLTYTITNGNHREEPPVDGEEPGDYWQDMGGSATYLDPDQLAQDREYKLRIVTPWTNVNSTVTKNLLTVVSIEVK